MAQKQQPRKSGDPFEARSRSNGGKRSSQPLLHQEGVEIQRFGTIRDLPIALDHKARTTSCQVLNQTLADSIILYNLYKKHHWLVRGHTFYQLHLLLDKHASEQLALVDLMAERVQTLGGIAVADPRHVAEITNVPRPPNGAEEVPAMLSRLLEAHETIIAEARKGADQADQVGDQGTNDILVSDVLRTNELQTWFVAEHLVDTPAVKA
jgi:starvation-inducible DNA-binding protein